MCSDDMCGTCTFHTVRERDELHQRARSVRTLDVGHGKEGFMAALLKYTFYRPCQRLTIGHEYVEDDLGSSEVEVGDGEHKDVVP